MEESEAEDEECPCAWGWTWPWWPSLMAVVENPEFGVPLSSISTQVGGL